LTFAIFSWLSTFLKYKKSQSHDSTLADFFKKKSCQMTFGTSLILFKHPHILWINTILTFYVEVYSNTINLFTIIYISFDVWVCKFENYSLVLILKIFKKLSNNRTLLYIWYVTMVFIFNIIPSSDKMEKGFVIKL